ncbi:MULTISPECIES: STM3941 family protein [unclassified Enterococcus]|uniref:STM3941 family protein n=1 Tax=unclassified Enterococcus TaxID=2608891 RepID=UPI0015517F12|nr:MULTISPECIES: STM3941 family protein [unclassified Enterococcus]MBS7578345.1 hypothetical protein [Enterococcus sp. MMGLQ5-2]MBS7585582.1 hypothetical protein [Enterococcus sp. MMGLQ5-1]NPD13441.1 hypothetical protein [Enterococcus sp. MMGLQ5-1]NPD38176.1 hypothetical protein [Enterococcus sp. MMGLQ5-2]
MTGNTHEYIVYEKKIKRLFVLFLFIFILICDFILLFYFFEDLDLLLLCLVTAPFALYGIVRLIKLPELYRRSVILTKDGFYDYSQAFATCDILIRWDDVVSIENEDIGKKQFVAVYVKEPEKIITRLNYYQHLIANNNLAANRSIINICMENNSQCSNNELIMEMEYYLEQFKVIE